MAVRATEMTEETMHLTSKTQRSFHPWFDWFSIVLLALAT